MSTGAETWHVTFTKLATAKRLRAVTTSWKCEGTWDNAACSAMHAMLTELCLEFEGDFVSPGNDHQKSIAIQFLRLMSDGNFITAFWLADKEFGWHFMITAVGASPVGDPTKQSIKDRAEALLAVR